jgi:excisionase family DNA binding protein
MVHPAQQPGGAAMIRPDPKDLVSMRAAAKLIGFSGPTIRRWLDNRTLTEYRVGEHAVRVDRHELLSLVVRVGGPEQICRCAGASGQVCR